jgi:hypothetical protein
MTYDGLRESLAEKLDKLGTDEVAVLNEIAGRLVLGSRQYGVLNLSQDSRDWTAEARAEALDLSVYLAIMTLGDKTRR